MLKSVSMDAATFERLTSLRLELQQDFRRHGGYGRNFDNPYDTNRIFALYPWLRLKPGFCWRLLTLEWVRYAGPYMFAVPLDLRRAPLSQRTEGPQHVPGALSDFMLAVEGDDSPWSYLSASLLARDADELGAYATGARFCNQTLVSSCPEVHGAERSEERRGCLAKLFRIPPSSAPPRGWEWSQPPPQNWRPQVQLTPEQAVVTFYTYKLYYGEAITRYTDTYQRGLYCPSRSSDRIALGPNSIVT